MLFPPYLIEYIPQITNKVDLYKENTRLKQVLKEKGYQESIMSKIFKRITNNHSLPKLQRQKHTTDTQEEDIRMGINLLYIKGTSEKLRCILTSHNTKFTF